MPDSAPRLEPAPSSGEKLELAAPWEFVGYQGDAAGDIQRPGASAETSPAPGSENQLEEDTAAQIAAAVANNELDWGSVIAFDGEKSPEPDQGPATPQPAPVSAAGWAETLETSMAALREATHAAQIGEVILGCCAQAFGRAFVFVVQYEVAMLWRALGPGSDGAVMAFRPELKEPSMFKTAVDSGKPAVLTAPATATDEAFFWAISPPPPGYVVTVPVVVSGQPREIFCVVSDDPSPSPEVLDVLERLGACAAEAHMRLANRS